MSLPADIEKSNPGSADVNGDDHNSTARVISPWINTEQSTPNREAIVRRVPKQVPIRPVSTFSYRDQRETSKVRAAPFPSIPTKREVQAAKAEVDQDIQRLRAELTVLRHEKASYNKAAHTFNPDSSVDGVHEYRGMIITDTVINSIIAENRAKQAESVGIVSVQKNAQITSLQELHPHMKQVIESQKKNLVPFLYQRVAHKKILSEHSRDLAEKYNQASERWNKGQKLTNEYIGSTSKMDVKTMVWPPEFPSEQPEIKHETRLKWAARDQPMYLCAEDRRCECFYDMNGFVEDPVREHTEFKDRLCWTAEERQTFIEKYRQYPKEFRKIAAALPEKTHKDVIEFYYVNRYELCLRENEAAGKKRGGRKKVISEGSTKKNY